MGDVINLDDHRMISDKVRLFYGHSGCVIGFWFSEDLDFYEKAACLDYVRELLQEELVGP